MSIASHTYFPFPLPPSPHFLFCKNQLHSTPLNASTISSLSPQNGHLTVTRLRNHKHTAYPLGLLYECAIGGTTLHGFEDLIRDRVDFRRAEAIQLERLHLHIRTTYRDISFFQRQNAWNITDEGDQGWVEFAEPDRPSL